MSKVGPDHFVTAQMMCLNVATGRMQWVNAGHPAPLLIRDRVVLDRLESPNLAGRIRRGAADGQCADPGTRVRLLCFTGGLIEEHRTGGKQFGEEQLIGCTNSPHSVAGPLFGTARLVPANVQVRSGG
ncbi:SpoIIE family protein phosphatase [Streptomyces sp. NPDC058247]|uniref:SpoIIE family protein phosphatase n=1 Tax=Streptomyces sp. NPDC058247 TaxID=3346401 RepID=UPI0036F05801